MARPPDKSETGKSETDKPESGKWTDGGPTPGGPQDKSFAYRQSRKAFITACEKAGADVVGRVHHARAPDGGPLFLDAAAFGPRLAPAGVLVAGYGAPGAGVLLALLADRIAQRLPLGTRLVLVLNGVKTVEVDDGKLASGPIALQWGRGTIKFRKVEIRPL